MNNNEKSNNKVAHKYKFTRAFTIIMAILIAIVIIPINMIVSKLDIKFDMTPNRIYSANLSKTTLALLDSLNETINIYFAYDLDDLVDGDDYNTLILKNAIEKYG